jgi:hypothetical protein
MEPGWWEQCGIVLTISDPITLKQAMYRADADLWRDAMKSESNSSLENGTWKLVALSANQNVIPCKWIVKTKRVKRDTVLDLRKYNERLVVKC